MDFPSPSGRGPERRTGPFAHNGAMVYSVRPGNLGNSLLSAT